MELDVAVVLVGPRDDANVGAVARAMKNCGLDDLRIVRARKPGARARRTAAHSEDVLDAARRFRTLADAVAGARRVAGFTARARRFGPPLELYTASAARRLARQARRETVALVFGPEDSGLSDAHVASCTELYKLPASDAREVYNLAQAVLLAVHGIVFGSGPAAPAGGAPRRGAELDLTALDAELARVLRVLRYPEPARPHDRTSRILARLRAQVRRAVRDSDDVALWRGLLARVRAPQ
jgi:TrmH family RNA methyltransferase